MFTASKARPTLSSHAIGTRFRGYVCSVHSIILVSPAALWAVNISKRRHHQRYYAITPSFVTSANICISNGTRHVNQLRRLRRAYR